MMFLRRINFTFLFKSILVLAVIFSFLLCLIQVENFTNNSLVVSNFSINTTSVPIHDSHIPQICNLANQKYSNQNNDLFDFLVSKDEGLIKPYSTEYSLTGLSYFRIDVENKIYIKNVTLLV